MALENWGFQSSHNNAESAAADHEEKMTFVLDPPADQKAAEENENSHVQPLNFSSINPTMQAQSESIATGIPNYVPDHLSEDQSVSSLESGYEPDLQHHTTSATNDSSRSIFRTYWKNGDENRPTRLGTSIAACSLETETSYDNNELISLERYTHEMTILPEWSSYLQEECVEETFMAKNCDDKTGYEQILKINEAGRTARPSAALLNDSTSKGRNFESAPSSPHNPLHAASSKVHSRRRRLFTRNYSKTVPPLPSYGYSYSTKKKGNSPLPFLLSNRRMLRSSLRDRSASLSEATRMTTDESFLSSQSRPSVSFDPKVSIHEYNKPYDQYISDGWSKNFA